MALEKKFGKMKSGRSATDYLHLLIKQEAKLPKQTYAPGVRKKCGHDGQQHWDVTRS